MLIKDMLSGEVYIIPAFSDSGGSQNRFLLGVYMPSEEKALLKLSVSVYYARPLEISYVFSDSDLDMIETNSIKLYNYGTSSYVGGLQLNMRPTSLAVVEDEEGHMKSVSFSIPSDAVLSLFFTRNVDATIDTDENGIPDLIES